MKTRLAVLEGIIDPRCDDVRAYPVLIDAAPVVYGRSLLASSIQFEW